MALTQSGSDAAVEQTIPPEMLCHSCRVRPIGLPADLVTARRGHQLDLLARTGDAPLAHFAAVAIGVRRDVEGWKRLASAEPDPAKAESFRAQATAYTVASLIIGQAAMDAKAVSVK